MSGSEDDRDDFGAPEDRSLMQGRTTSPHVFIATKLIYKNVIYFM